MFKVGDRVEVAPTDDPMYGQLGEVVELFSEGFLTDIRVLLDQHKEWGHSPLWFGPTELRKVEA